MGRGAVRHQPLPTTDQDADELDEALDKIDVVEDNHTKKPQQKVQRHTFELASPSKAAGVRRRRCCTPCANSWRQIRSTWAELNPNCRFMFLFMASWGLSRSLWMTQMLSTYLWDVSHSSETVGLIAGVSGVAQLLTAPLAGYAADRLRRDSVLKFSSATAFVAIIVSVIVFSLDSEPGIFAAMAIWGVFRGSFGPPAESLFADSLPTGKRTMIFAAKFAVDWGFSAIGPVLNIMYFLFRGNDWVHSDLQIVAVVGVSTMLLPAVFLLFFNDGLAIGSESEAIGTKKTASDGAADGRAATETKDSKIDEEQGAAQPPPADELQSPSVPTEATFLPKCCCLWLRKTVNYVPTALTVSDLTIAWGAGMTVQFFPLYFKEEFGMSPAGLNALYLVSPVAVAVTSMYAGRFGITLGRIQTVLLFEGTATLCLFMMAFQLPIWVIIPVWLIRTALMNATSTLLCLGVVLLVAAAAAAVAPHSLFTAPLRRSILMDFVPKAQRGRWNSLENIAQFSWTGSAVMGGFIVERWGYRTCYAITTIFYLAGTLVHSSLWPLVPRAISHFQQVRTEDMELSDAENDTMLDVAHEDTPPVDAHKPTQDDDPSGDAESTASH